MRFLVVFLFTASLAFAGSLEELKSRLEALKGGSTVSARLEIQVSGTEGEGDEPTLLDGRAGATVGEDSKGVTITYDAASVERAEQETASHGGGSRSFGARFALSSIEARDVHELLNAAPFLLRQINRGELVSEKDDRFDGHPAHLLVLKVNPKINPQAKRFIKDFSVTANIWLGADGLPVAARIVQQRKGRALLVISFESEDDDEYHYRVVGDRLVVVLHSRVTTGSGAGQHSNSRMVTTLTLP